MSTCRNNVVSEICYQIAQWSSPFEEYQCGKALDHSKTQEKWLQQLKGITKDLQDLQLPEATHEEEPP